MLNELLTRYPKLLGAKEDIIAAATRLIECFEADGKLLICGNGGSAADAEHISGELLKGFLKKRELPYEKREEMKTRCPESEALLGKLQGGLSAIPLTSLSSLSTAVANDSDPDMIFAQAVMALGREGDALICISTSGNAANTVNAAVVAKSLGMTVIALTGEGGGRLAAVANVAVRVPEKETFKVQELHLPLYHYLCAAVEEHFYKF